MSFLPKLVCFSIVERNPITTANVPLWILGLSGVSKRRKKSQVESPSEAADEGQRPKNKCRQQSKQQETPQAEADVEVHHESSTADISKKSRKHMSLEEDENGEQTEPVAAEESEPPQKKPKNDKGDLLGIYLLDI